MSLLHKNEIHEVISKHSALILDENEEIETNCSSGTMKGELCGTPVSILMSVLIAVEVYFHNMYCKLSKIAQQVVRWQV